MTHSIETCVHRDEIRDDVIIMLDSMSDYLSLNLVQVHARYT